MRTRIDTSQLKPLIHKLRKDYSDLVFGRLTVNFCAGTANGRNYWNCTCSCGKTTIVDGVNLKNNKILECNLCASSKYFRKDKVGEKMGKLTVIKFSHKQNGYNYWECVCECGNKTTRQFKKDITSCGCETIKAIENEARTRLLGQQFERWTVLEFSHRTNNWKFFWKCQCECGTKKTLNGAVLIAGASKSCGCYASESTINRQKIKDDFTGQKFNQLTLIKKDETRSDNLTYWLCTCDCGNPNIISRSISMLKAGTVKNCGCVKIQTQFKAVHSPTRAEENPRYSMDYERWRKKVYRRDKSICQISGKTNCEIHAHHIKSWIDNEDLRFKIENGITMKAEIHCLFHSLYGRGYNTQEQLNEFKERYDNKEFDPKYY